MKNEITRQSSMQENKNAVNPNKGHSRGILAEISLIPSRCSHLIKAKVLCYNNQNAEDPRLQLPGMTSLCDNSLTTRGFTARSGIPQTCNAGYSGRVGFTLIELLVVVLIIGILAAVALPQYQVAVMKSRFAKLYNLAMTYDRVIQEYQLTNGTYPTRFDMLAIDQPGGMNTVNVKYYSCIQNDEFYCCLIPNVGSTSQAINCGDSNYTIAFHYMNKANSQYCGAKTTDVVATKVCKHYGPGEAGWALLSPEGHKDGYRYYKMN